MRKVILTMIAFMLFFASVKAQPFTAEAPLNKTTADSTNLVTVKDSTYIQDARLNYMVQTIYPAIVNFIEDYNSKVKLDGKEITKKQGTNQFVRKYEKLLAEYQSAFLEVKDVKVDSVKVVTEFQDLEKEIQRIDADPDIKLSDAKKKVAEIRIRQQKLASYYNQLK